MMCIMARVRNSGKTDPVTRVLLLQVKRTDMAFINGLIRLLMKVAGSTTRCVEKAPTNGVMVELTPVNGSTTTCMVSVFTSGLMDAIMKGSTLKTTDRVRGFSHGPMVASIPAHGRRARCMVRELIGTRMALKPRECGLRDSALLF